MKILNINQVGINRKLVKWYFICLVFTAISLNGYSQKNYKTGYLTKNGAWCWFSDPRAIYSDGLIITGWVTADGTIEAASLDIDNNSVETKELFFQLEKDDHDNPSFLKTSDGNIIATYTRHSRKEIYINKTTDGSNVSSFGDARLVNPLDTEELKKFPFATVTYANPYSLKSENNRIYCFGRWTGYKPNIMWSDDDGTTWSKSKVMIAELPFLPGKRPYVKYFSDGNSKIHMVFTDGHPRLHPANSVYYAYYEDGALYRADKSKITEIENLPFSPSKGSLIYKASEKKGRAWIADIGQDDNGNPVVLYTRHPEEVDHRYFYARYDGEKWVNTELCKSGRWFPQTPEREEESEPHYFGGMTLHPDNANVIYLSRQINGRFEIERWETDDLGKTWNKEPVTQNSEYDNVRPYVPRGLQRNMDEIVLWMENQKYIHFTNYKTSIKYGIRNN
ncbi:BNR-4 repeat-containing protein [Sunxiuqinia rutila]|uniref:BNR-4 repeat-containing protein n=1 Tax=Sunxiuqinia rutila TaxID=1397841 RepID=UPI003D35EB30